MTQQIATELTPQQERAAEMLVAGERLIAVSRALRVDRATVWRWTKLPAFQETLEALRAIARRDVTEKMRHNVLAACAALGVILDDPRVPPRDKISAARVALAAGREPVHMELAEADRGKARSSWPELVMATARRAAEMANLGFPLLLAQTPGAAWKESGLESALPGSFARVRELANCPDELQAECERLLEAFRDQLDAKTLGGLTQ